MQASLEKYKRLLLLIKNDKQMSIEQKREVISKILKLENMLIKALTQRILTGSLMLNISSLPPRLRVALQRVLNRRLHIMYCLEQERKKAQKKELDKKKEIEILLSQTDEEIKVTLNKLVILILKAPICLNKTNDLIY